MFGSHKRLTYQIKETITYCNRFRLFLALGFIGIFLVVEKHFVIKSLLTHQEEQQYLGRSVTRGENADVIDQLPTNVGTKGTINVESTLVTAYFQLKTSKHDSSEYLSWLNNSLCIEDAMVIFTTPDLVDHMAELRNHALNRTFIVSMNLEDIAVSNKIHYDDEFWKEEGGTYDDRDINLFKIWMGKSWFVNKAIDLNPFGSDVFSWTDSGHFRLGNYFCSKTVVRHPEIIPEDRVVLFPWRGLDYQRDKPNHDKPIFAGNFGDSYLAGGAISARINPWRVFQEKIEESIELYSRNHVSLHDDQPVMQSICMRNPGLCAVVRWDAPFGTGDGSKCRDPIDFNCLVENGGWKHHKICDFFSMSFRLHHGGDINTMYWDPGMGIPTMDQDPGLYMA